MQVAHGADPYIVPPYRFAADPWFRYVSWTRTTSVYGPLWSLAVAGCVALVGTHVVPGLLLVKAMTVGLVILAAGGLSRVATDRGDGLRGDPGLLPLAFALNPLVVTAGALGGNAEVALAAAFAWAVVWDQRGRKILAGLLLAAAALVKAYAILPLVVYVIVRLRRSERAQAVRVVLASAALAVVAYAPYWAGPRTFRGIADVGLMASSSLAGAVERWVGALLSGLDVAGHGRDASWLVHAVAALAVGLACVVVARSRRTPGEPWRASAILLAAFLFVTPWFLPWYAIGLLALALPLADTRITALALAFTATALIQVPGAAAVPQSLLRYGVPLAIAFTLPSGRGGEPAPAAGARPAAGSPGAWPARGVPPPAARRRSAPGTPTAT
jgi:alpha-1,6-mannosyltransferase